MTSTAVMKNLEPQGKFEQKPAEVAGFAVLPPFSQFLSENIIQGIAVILIYMYSALGVNEMRAVRAGLNSKKMNAVKNDTAKMCHFYFSTCRSF